MTLYYKNKKDKPKSVGYLRDRNWDDNGAGSSNEVNIKVNEKFSIYKPHNYYFIHEDRSETNYGRIDLPTYQRVILISFRVPNFLKCTAELETEVYFAQVSYYSLIWFCFARLNTKLKHFNEPLLKCCQFSPTVLIIIILLQASSN